MWITHCLSLHLLVPTFLELAFKNYELRINFIYIFKVKRLCFILSKSNNFWNLICNMI